MDLLNQQDNLISVISDILDKIKNGVVLEDGSIRQFTIIDYYRTLDLSFSETYKILEKNFSLEDIVLFRSFISVNSNFVKWIDASINNYYKSKVVLGVQFDENKKIIPNTGREITLDEKKIIIDYIRSIGAPINDKTVTIVQRELVRGDLSVNNVLKK